ncbi:MAG: hypothetical protein IT384_08205 [Deltaproteobacteria bacterium]|nr:hypothetical protein [Deltaproteobacteria bacterium]
MLTALLLLYGVTTREALLDLLDALGPADRLRAEEAIEDPAIRESDLAALHLELLDRGALDGVRRGGAVTLAVGFEALVEQAVPPAGGRSQQTSVALLFRLRITPALLFAGSLAVAGDPPAEKRRLRLCEHLARRRLPLRSIGARADRARLRALGCETSPGSSDR